MPQTEKVDSLRVMVRPRTDTTTEGDEITLYDVSCPVPRCGFTSYGWASSNAANGRARTHVAEHVGDAPTELYEFREGARHPSWVDDGEDLAADKEA